MSKIKKMFLIFSILSLPVTSNAFLEFCFPWSSVILLYVFGWPSMVLGLFFNLDSPSLAIPLILGVVVDFTGLFLLGKWIDASNIKKGKVTNRKYKTFLPKIFLFTSLALILIMFIDPTCAGRN